MSQVAERKRLLIPLPEAAVMVEMHYETLRAEATEEKLWTVIRKGVGKGFRIKLKADEIEAYLDGGHEALKRFRTKKGRK